MTLDGIQSDQYMAFDVISDEDLTYYDGKRTSTEYRIEFTYFVDKSKTHQLVVLPDIFEMYLIGLGYRPQGNGRNGFDTTTNRLYWQKDFKIKERRI